MLLNRFAAVPAAHQVHEHLDRSELPVHLGDRCIHRALVGDVRFDDHEARARVAEVCPEPLDFFVVDARHRHAVTILEQSTCHRGSQRTGPAGHERSTTHSSALHSTNVHHASETRSLDDSHSRTLARSTRILPQRKARFPPSRRPQISDARAEVRLHCL